MKKFLALLFVGSFLLIPTAHAERPVIRIVDKPHINFDGTFHDNELAATLLPNGKLGKLIYGVNSKGMTFVIDAALVDEVAQMADGYSFADKKDLGGQKTAQNWLFRLKYATSNNSVVALPYGNPDEKLVKSIAPTELLFYSKYAQAKLQTFLGRSVLAEYGWGLGSSRLNYQFHSDYSANRHLLTGLSSITSSQELLDLRARLAIPMNPLLNNNESAFFAYHENATVDLMSNRLKVISGRYQITSKSAKLPITLVNNFDTASVVSVSLIPMNSRIQVENINNVTIAPKSRQQILVPVDVIAPGSTLVLAQFMNSKGQLVGQVSKLNLTATIIDSRVAWFTTSAAILLFLGAITQSVRRVRRSRHEK
jgi:hypothetical protein